jgi:hypothetical protein
VTATSWRQVHAQQSALGAPPVDSLAARHALWGYLVEHPVWSAKEARFICFGISRSRDDVALGLPQDEDPSPIELTELPATDRIVLPRSRCPYAVAAADSARVASYVLLEQGWVRPDSGTYWGFAAVGRRPLAISFFIASLSRMGTTWVVNGVQPSY